MRKNLYSCRCAHRSRSSLSDPPSCRVPVSESARCSSSRVVWRSATRSRFQAIRRRHFPVPITRILDRALLIAVIHVYQPVALRLSIGPLEVVHQAPRVERPHARPIRNRSRQFRKLLAEKFSSPRIRYASALIRPVEIPAATLRDLNNRVVVLARNLHHQVVDAARPHFQTRFRERTLRRHHRAESRIRIAPRRRVRLNFRAAESPAFKRLRVTHAGNNAPAAVAVPHRNPSGKRACCTTEAGTALGICSLAACSPPPRTVAPTAASDPATNSRRFISLLR